MDIKVKRLTPELAEDYVNFFDTTPHNGDDDKCYCVTWRDDDFFESDGHWFSTREERRAAALKFVQNGSLRGYLAYNDGKIVGWCNTNENCRSGMEYLSSFFPVGEHSPDVKIKPIFCFVIAPEMQRKGIATQLVERICKDAAEDGFDFVEAYVNDTFTDVAHDFRGPRNMYKKCGFTKFAEQDGKVVMRKALK